MDPKLQDYHASNVALDSKHDLPGSVQAPEAPGTIDLWRCYRGCGRLMTSVEVRAYGRCPSCSNHMFSRTMPRDWLERLRFEFLNWCYRWEVHGVRGWGWPKGLKVPASLRSRST